MGVQAMVTEIGGKFQAIVLTDSNNVTREIINEAKRRTKHVVSNLEIYTTDNHYVNAINLDNNPLGRDGSVFDVVSLVSSTV